MRELEEKVRSYVEECGEQGRWAHVEDLAKHLNMSERSLYRRCAHKFGRSTKRVLHEIELRIADELLSTSELTTREIAYHCGFKTRRSFFRAYKAIRRHTPRNPIAQSGPSKNV